MNNNDNSPKPDFDEACRFIIKLGEQDARLRPQCSQARILSEPDNKNIRLSRVFFVQHPTR